MGFGSSILAPPGAKLGPDGLPSDLRIFRCKTRTGWSSDVRIFRCATGTRWLTFRYENIQV